MVTAYKDTLTSEESRKAYNREKSARYRERNREKTRQYAKEYREKMGAEAYREYQKAWQRANPDRLREHRKNGDPEKRSARQQRYYDKNKRKKNDFRVELLAREKEAKATRPRPDFCEVCGCPPGKHGKSRLCFDHDHQTGAFRGWLCNGCNLALGYVRDNPEILRKLASYLEQ